MGSQAKSSFSFSRFSRRISEWLISPLIRLQLKPEQMTLSSSRVCYVLDSDALSSVLIVQKACRQLGLPLPLRSDSELPIEESLIALQSLKGWFIRRADRRVHLEQLSKTLKSLTANEQDDILLVPVAVFLGRMPDREKDVGWFKILFSENWPIAGRFRRFISLLLHGRSTLVQFSKPISLKEALQDTPEPKRAVRKISRVLRVHSRRVRSSVLGPDLSHRRTLVGELLRSRSVREAIRNEAEKKGISTAKARKAARKYANEIAADYSYPVIRVLHRALTWFWNRIYDGVKVHNDQNLANIDEGAEVIYVPCHRSHIDYLLVSYLLYNRGVVIPHIAAGVNLNIPVVGSILRRGGAFFLRRTFKSNALYSTVFNEYVNMIFAKGVAMEYFIEGTRSRTGRPLQPATGMLAMTVRSYLKHPQRPTVFVPIYIGYERLVEAGSYLGELSGGQKKKESLFGLLKSFRILREQYGQVHVSFGEPIHLEPVLNQIEPAWRETDPQANKPRWLTQAVDHLARDIMIRINLAANINPINLLALVMLSTPKHALSKEDFIAQLDLYRELLSSLSLSDLVTITDMPSADIIEYAESMGVISRVQHPLGDVYRCEERSALILSYFRNNIRHITAIFSWCACIFLNNQSFSRKRFMRIGRAVYPYLKGELFLPWDEAEFTRQSAHALKQLTDLGLLVKSDEPDLLQRVHGATGQALQLKMLGRNVFSSLERYYITIAVLVKNGSGVLRASELENLCQLTAQRLALIHSFETPEYFDKNLFKQFIRRLQNRKVIQTDEDRRLTFDGQLEQVVEDAKEILSKEVRHNILQASREQTGKSEQPEKAEA